MPLDTHDVTVQRLGSFVYAGGLEIRDAAGVVAELSDLRIMPGDLLIAISDRGYLFEARLRFDQQRRLVGLADPEVMPLLDEQGQPLSGAAGDAEALAILPQGRLIAFERDHRIWLYPSDGSAPRPVTKPDADFPANEGIEAMTAYPAGGPTAYLVGAEAGTIWLCSLEAPCRDTPLGRLVPDGFALTALAAYGDEGAFVLLGRSYDPRRGVHTVIRLIATAGASSGRIVDELAIADPLTVDNFEGVAVVPRDNGGIRLYLLSDNNGSATQHTYLLAFDWQPAL